jgi:adenylate cyclase
VRVTAGEEFCPPPASDEHATLERIGAPPDVRLACQLRPQGDVSVVPLVRTARPIYRPTAPQRSREREVVVLYCDVRNREEPANDHLPQDILYVLTLYVEGVGNAIRASGGTLSFVAVDSICALFGHEGARDNPAQDALRAAGAIEGVLADLNNRLGRQHGGKMDVAVSIHVGRAAVGEVGSSEPPVLMAIGEAIEAAQAVRHAAADRGRAFAISQAVYDGAGLRPVYQEEVVVKPAGSDGSLTVYLADAAPIPSPTWTLHGEIGHRALLRRLWAGG